MVGGGMDPITAQTISAISSAALTLLTAILAGAAFWQVRSVRTEAAKSRTLEICNRYDNDPLLDGITRRLRIAMNTKDIIKNPNEHRIDVVALLNYLDSIAIGINQNLYIEKLAKDHVYYILNFHVKEYIMDDSVAKALNINPDNYADLIDIYKKWNEPLTARYGHAS